MTIRTEAQIVLAANLAQDLTNLVVAYLELWRQHAQGVNGITVPDEPYTVVFQPLRSEFLHFKLVHTQTVTWEEPVYYDVDSDYFQESWGASNLSHHVSRWRKEIREHGLGIPFKVLLQARGQMEGSIKAVAAAVHAEEEERARLARIAELQAEIDQLKGKP
jgi:hypothetical protein